MPLSTPTVLSSVASTAINTTVTSGTVSPTAGALIIVTIRHIQNNGSATHTSITTTCSGTWTFTKQIDLTAANGAPNARVSIWTAVVPASPGSGTFTGNFSAQTNRKTIEVTQITGQDTTTPIGATGSNSSTTTTLSLTLSASPAADSCVIGSVVNYDNTNDTDIVPGTNYTELVDLGTGVNPDSQCESEYDSTPSSTTVDWSSLSGSTISVGGAIEIKAAQVAAEMTRPVKPVRSYLPISQLRI